MDVIHFSHNYVPFTDGSVEYIRSISEQLAKREHDVTVIATDALFLIRKGEHYSPKYEVRDGVQIKRVPFYWFSVNIEFTASLVLRNVLKPVSPTAAGLLHDPAGVKLLHQGLQENVDVIQASPVPRSCVTAAIIMANRTDTPTVIRPALHLEEERVDLNFWAEILNESDAVVCATNVEAQRLQEHGVDESQFHVIGVGVDYEEIRSADPDPEITDDEVFTVLSLSSNHSRAKGTFQVIEAASALPDIQFLFAGSGWEGVKSEVEIPDNCIYLGFLEEHQKHRVLNSVDLLVQPSIVESYGIVFMEALAAGIPVIPADSPQMRELYSDVGIPVPHGDTAELIAAIETLRDDTERYNRLAENAVKTAQSHSRQQIADEIEELYIQLLER